METHVWSEGADWGAPVWLTGNPMVKTDLFFLTMRWGNWFQGGGGVGVTLCVRQYSYFCDRHSPRKCIIFIPLREQRNNGRLILSLNSINNYSKEVCDIFMLLAFKAIKFSFHTAVFPLPSLLKVFKNHTFVWSYIYYTLCYLDCNASWQTCF